MQLGREQLGAAVFLDGSMVVARFWPALLQAIQERGFEEYTSTPINSRVRYLAAARYRRAARPLDRLALPATLKSRCYAVPRMVGTALRSPAAALAIVLATLMTMPLAGQSVQDSDTGLRQPRTDRDRREVRFRNASAARQPDLLAVNISAVAGTCRLERCSPSRKQPD
jgi:hypothetical protein